VLLVAGVGGIKRTDMPNLDKQIEELEAEITKWKDIADDLYEVLKGYCGYGNKELYDLKIEVFRNYEEATNQ
jgi:hypothetical protein